MKLPGEFVSLSFNEYSYICSYVFAHLRPITFKFGKFINFKTLFPVVSTDFPRGVLWEFLGGDVPLGPWNL